MNNSAQDNLDKENNLYDIELLKGHLRYVLHDYYPAVNWKPDGVFVEENGSSPFSVTMELAVKLFLDSNGGDIHSFYDEDFPRKDVICNEAHLDILVYQKGVFESKVYNNSMFLRYMCMSAEYAALSYLYGAEGAPLLSLQVTLKMMQQMRESGKITQDFWRDFEKYCESYVKTERRRGYLKKPE